MPTTIYTLGYAQWEIAEVEAQVNALDAVLVDVRRSPNTTKPGFSRSDLQKRLDDRYVHIPAFGNVNYKEGPIEIAAPDQGLQNIQALDRPPILMCGCRHPDRCHRSVVAQRIADELGGTVKHLRSRGERAQPGLFDDPSEP